MIGGPNTFVWPPGDGDYMKIILKEKRDGSRFRILGSRVHPMGDFDTPGLPGFSEPTRVYRTSKGWRIFFTGRYGEPPGAFLRELADAGGDPIYARACQERGYYSARLDPKIPVSGMGFSVCHLTAQEGSVLPEWERLIAVHDEITNALATGTVLV